LSRQSYVIKQRGVYVMLRQADIQQAMKKTEKQHPEMAKMIQQILSNLATYDGKSVQYQEERKKHHPPVAHSTSATREPAVASTTAAANPRPNRVTDRSSVAEHKSARRPNGESNSPSSDDVDNGKEDARKHEDGESEEEELAPDGKLEDKMEIRPRSWLSRGCSRIGCLIPSARALSP